MKEITGTGVALVTPFDKDRNIDFPALERLVNHVIEGGINYLVCLGTTGETPTLSKKDKTDALAAIKSANGGRLPMVIGIGGNNTAAVKEEIQSVNLNDYVAILSSSPNYNKPSQEGIYQHYKTLANSTDSPIILYNVPSRTGSNIESATTLRLAGDFENIVAIKEASPVYTQSTEVIKDKPKDFKVISGDDEFGLPMTLAGGSGTISVIAQGLPKLYSKMIAHALKGEVSDAYACHYRIMDITRAIYVEGNPVGIKVLLSHLGICEPYTRLPLVPATEKLSNRIKSLLDQTL